LTNRVESAVNVLVVLESSFIGLPVMPVSNTAEVIEPATFHEIIPATALIVVKSVLIKAIIDSAIIHLKLLLQ
jgi:hypothetical protein